MKIKERTEDRLIIENKSINFVGIVACISIYAALSYKLVQLIQEKNLSIIFLLFFVASTVFTLLGLAIVLSVEFFILDKALQQIMIVSQMFSIKKVAIIAWSDIKDIEVAKTNTNEDDIGGVRYEIYAYLTSRKKIELGRSTSEKTAQNIAERVRAFMNF